MRGFMPDNSICSRFMEYDNLAFRQTCNQSELTDVVTLVNGVI